MDYIAYLKTLKPEDWSKPVTDKWTVKDVVAHLVGWEREVAQTFLVDRTANRISWYVDAGDYDEFNKKIKREFLNWMPDNLLEEWGKWEEDLNNKILSVGEDISKVRQENLSWVIDGKIHDHTEWHINQIKKSLTKS